MQPAPERTAWYRILYVQVLIAVAIGIAIGYFWPGVGQSLKPLGDAFIKLVKMIIAPIIFCTVVHGIASMADLKKLGRIGGKSLLYFEVISTFALIIGLVVVNFLRPGAGFNVDPQTLDPKIGQTYAAQAHSQTTTDFFLNIIPSSFFEAFVKGELLPVLFVALLTAFAINALGSRSGPVLHAIDTVGQLFFGIMGIIIKVAPLGALGAMAFTVGKYGMGALGNLAQLMAGFYLTAIIFVVLVLGSVARVAGFSIFRFILYIKEELLLVLGTSSSETALPGIMRKLTNLGCAKGTVGLVIPTGYSFNLDGTNIYLSMAAVFLAQATNTPLSLREQITLLLVAMISSKGAAAVTGGGFVTLAATLAAVPSVPIQSLALLLGIDRFMSECRALTNLVGNGVATVAISRWEGEVAASQVRERLLKNANEADATVERDLRAPS
jgi:aerobic C4-dicarboxylate transport protein